MSLVLEGQTPFVVASRILFKEFGYLRMVYGIARVVWQKILLRNVGDIFRFAVLSQQMIKGLVLCGSDILRNGLIPFFRVVEYRVDVKDYSPKWKYSMTHNLPYFKLRTLYHEGFSVGTSDLFVTSSSTNQGFLGDRRYDGSKITEAIPIQRF
jgi:hypothetical protein